MRAGVAAFLGHCYPVWLGFRGGKGVATLMGVVLAMDWRIGAIYAAVWLTTLVAVRISSLGGMLAAASVPIAVWSVGKPEWQPFALSMAVLVLWRHKENIIRLLRGEEPRIGSKNSAVSNG